MNNGFSIISYFSYATYPNSTSKLQKVATQRRNGIRSTVCNRVESTWLENCISVQFTVRRSLESLIQDILVDNSS